MAPYFVLVVPTETTERSPRVTLRTYRDGSLLPAFICLFLNVYLQRGATQRHREALNRRVSYAEP